MYLTLHVKVNINFLSSYIVIFLNEQFGSEFHYTMAS